MNRIVVILGFQNPPAHVIKLRPLRFVFEFCIVGHTRTWVYSHVKTTENKLCDKTNVNWRRYAQKWRALTTFISKQLTTKRYEERYELSNALTSFIGKYLINKWRSFSSHKRSRLCVEQKHLPARLTTTIKYKIRTKRRLQMTKYKW